MLYPQRLGEADEIAQLAQMMVENDYLNGECMRSMAASACSRSRADGFYGPITRLSRSIELAGIGPAPMGGMILADMGAEVIRVDRAGAGDPRSPSDVSGRGKKSIAINLKDPDGVETLLRILENADVLIDPFRPGVCEKLGLGPEVCLESNPRLFSRA